ncbi:MAG: hypothetical protein ACIAQZ_04825 [Sedimentisphaeraceae bacterium JB056]
MAYNEICSFLRCNSHKFMLKRIIEVMLEMCKATNQSEGKCFLSWSGQYSKQLTEKFNTFFSETFKNKNTFVSFVDIEMGSNWVVNLEKELNDSSLGLLFVTHENISSPWLFYELGRLTSQNKNAMIMYFGVDRRKINSPLKNIQSVQIANPDDIQIDTKALNNIKEVFLEIIKKTTNNQPEKKFEDYFQDKEEIEGKLKTLKDDISQIIGENIPPKEIEDIHYTTVNNMLTDLKNCKEALFINVQMTLSEWFSPYMQVHLALHDSVIRNHENETIASRIMIIPECYHDIVATNNRTIDRLKELSLIHLAMSMPIAVIALDDFLEIILSERNYFNGILKHIGLPEIRNIDYKQNNKLTYCDALATLKKALIKMLIEPGKIKPTIDCAVMFQNQNIRIWGGGLDLTNRIAYYPINKELHEKKQHKNHFENGFHIPLKAVEDIAECYHENLKKFAIKLQEKVVLANHSNNEEPNDMKGKSAIHNLSNYIGNIGCLAKETKNKYHPLHLLRCAGKGQFISELKNEL